MSLVKRDIDLTDLKLHLDSRYFSVAILTWVVYELILTNGDAINLFWMQRWTVGKALFLVNRIATLFTIIVINLLNLLTFDSEYACVVLTWSEYIGSIFIISIVAFMLATRVYALWKGYHIVLTIFFLVLTGNVCNYLVIYSSALRRGTTVLYPSPYTGCTVIPNSNITWVIFANTLTFEALSIGLIIYKAWPIARQSGVKVPLFSLLLEDGLAYYLSFTTAKLFTIGCIYAPTIISTVALPAYPSVSVAALAVNRLFIRLQRTMLNKTPGLTDYTTAGFSTMKYSTSSGEDSSKGMNAIGGSDKAGRGMRARRHPRPDEELFSRDEGEVEMFPNKKERELHHTTSIRHVTIIAPTPTTSGSSVDANTTMSDSKPCQAV